MESIFVSWYETGFILKPCNQLRCSQSKEQSLNRRSDAIKLNYSVKGSFTLSDRYGGFWAISVFTKIEKFSFD